MSRIYSGRLNHQRILPKRHGFEYQVFMMYLDLDELDSVFALSPFWSLSRPNLAAFYPDKYLVSDSPQPSGVSLKQQVCSLVEQSLGITQIASVRLLTNVQLFGYSFNPLSVFFCFDQDEKLVAQVLEVTNTPWKETHHYCLKCDPNRNNQSISFNKSFHVSPFQEMSMQYQWKSSLPKGSLAVSMASYDAAQQLTFTASLALTATEVSSSTLNGILIQWPLMTIKVVAAIYWQALKLWLRGFQFVPHPNKNKDKA